MIASRSVEFPFQKGIGRQCGRDSAMRLHKLMGDPQFHFLVEMSSQVGKVWVFLLEYAESETTDVVSGWNNMKTAGKILPRQILSEHLSSGRR